MTWNSFATLPTDNPESLQILCRWGSLTGHAQQCFLYCLCCLYCYSMLPWRIQCMVKRGFYSFLKRGSTGGERASCCKRCFGKWIKIFFVNDYIIPLKCIDRHSNFDIVRMNTILISAGYATNERYVWFNDSEFPELLNKVADAMC